MKKSEIVKRFDSWELDSENETIILLDCDNKELDRLDINGLINIWLED